jgi:hypothetical protein
MKPHITSLDGPVRAGPGLPARRVTPVGPAQWRECPTLGHRPHQPHRHTWVPEQGHHRSGAAPLRMMLVSDCAASTAALVPLSKSLPGTAQTPRAWRSGARRRANECKNSAARRTSCGNLHCLSIWALWQAARALLPAPPAPASPSRADSCSGSALQQQKRSGAIAARVLWHHWTSCSTTPPQFPAGPVHAPQLGSEAGGDSVSSHPHTAGTTGLKPQG